MNTTYKDLPKPASQSREEYFEKLIDLAGNYFEDDGSHDDDWKQSILSETYDKIESLKSLLLEAQEDARYWERKQNELFPPNE